jgi:hypothetical protein
MLDSVIINFKISVRMKKTYNFNSPNKLNTSFPDWGVKNSPLSL